jgi:hypothetical protein
MTSPLPPHLAAAIQERIATLREARRLDEPPSQPPLRGYPTFPTRRSDCARRMS